MKNLRSLLFALFAFALTSPVVVVAQEEAAEVGNHSFSASLDFFSNYIWRGSKFGLGPSVQPSVSFTTGNLEIGAWGAFNGMTYLSGDTSMSFTPADYAESDLYISYGFPFGLSLGITDYYYPGLNYFDYSTGSGAHAFEVNAAYGIKGLSLAANYIINEAGGAASAGGDMYFELGYEFSAFEVFVGGGNGWHTSDGEFDICNVGISAGKEIKVTDAFSIPVTGSVILNPDKKQFFVVAGFSL
jgi:hypothetical protein